MKNIAANFGLKAISILISLLVVPLTIDYLDSERYGIWLTISSIAGWATIFDLGLANGFKNKFAEAKAKGNIKLAREYVSTTYAIITLIVIALFAVIYVVNLFIDWPSVLNISQSYRHDLHIVFLLLGLFFALSMIGNIFAKLMEADQRSAISGSVYALGQLLSLGVIVLLTLGPKGNLVKLATFFSATPVLTVLLCSFIILNFTRFKKYAPSFHLIRKNLVKNVMGLGVRFFLIYLSAIAIFQVMNIVLSRECGPESVTEYNIAYKYFSMIYMATLLIISPLWASFTDAYTMRDIKWMKSTLSKLEKGLLIAVATALVMLMFSNIFYKILVGDKVIISFAMSLCVMAYALTQVSAALYMHLINGIGAIALQFYIYLAFAVIAFPLMTLACRMFGPVGIVFVPALVYLVQAISGRIQLHKLINGTARGIWTK